VEELRRALPVVRELVRRAGVPVSIDTTKAEVARAAIEAGAEVVNDVSCLQRDPVLGTAVARGDAALCLMHTRGTPQDMRQRAVYADLLGEVHDVLALNGASILRVHDVAATREALAVVDAVRSSSS